MLSRRKFISHATSLALLKFLCPPSKSEAATWQKFGGTSGGSTLPRGWYGWGDGTYGRFGACTPAGLISTPVAVCAISTDVIQVAFGNFHHMGLRANGTVVAWGMGGSGQFGNNTACASTIYSVVTACGISTANAIAAGSVYSLALLSSGSLMAWGCGTCGVLGTNAITTRSTPVAVCGITSAKAIAAGQCFSLALLTNGTVMSWGANYYGELGNCNCGTARCTPVAVCGLSDVVSIASGSYHALALLSNGCVMAWGMGGYGQLGNNVAANRSTPVAVCNITNAIAIAAGTYISMALLSSGRVMTWGAGFCGALGDNTITNKSTPVSVCNISEAVALTSGGDFGIALLSTGCIVSWGDGYSGQIGNNDCVNQSTPVAVCSISDTFSNVAKAKDNRRQPALFSTWSTTFFFHLG